jgi:hypothetical protein
VIAEATFAGADVVVEDVAVEDLALTGEGCLYVTPTFYKNKILCKSECI